MAQKQPIAARRHALSEPQPAGQPASFGKLARRVAGWTSNLIATGIVIVAALGLGRQLVQWWRVESPPVASSDALSPADAPLGSDDQADSRTLEFGDQPLAIHLRTFAGTRDQVAGALLAESRQAAETASPLQPEPSDAETRLLRAIDQLKPAEIDAAGRQFFVRESAFPMAVATAPAPAASGGAKLGATARRVVAWGIAVPASADMWTLYTFQFGRTTAATFAVDSIALPPGSVRSLAVRDQQGGALVAFSGNSAGQEWVSFFAAWLPRHGWSVAQPWESAEGFWHAQFRQAEADGDQRLDVQFGPDGQGGQSGLLTIAADSNRRGK